MGQLKLIAGTKSKVQNDYINRNLRVEPKQGVVFVEFLDQITTRKSRRLGENYKNSYNPLRNHITDFCVKYNAVIFTDSVNEEFIEDFIVYLETKELKQTYIRNMLVMLKGMIKKAASYGYAVDSSYDEIDLKDEDITSVYLSMNEITRIYYYQGLSRKHQYIRDLFIVGCLTALRYSDYSTLDRSNFTPEYIIKVTKKTGKRVVIPIHQYIKEILRKYNGDISISLSIQYFNRELKKITQVIGFNDTIDIVETRGGKLTTITKQKWEMITSHTARRSAATNMYLTGRMKVYEIMQLTGHTTERSFFRYIKVTVDDTIARIAGDPFFKI